MPNEQPGKGYPTIPQPKKVGNTGESAIQPTHDGTMAGTRKKSDMGGGSGTMGRNKNPKAVDQGASGD